MNVLTIFFCGTGSTQADYAHKNYHSGELISTLAREVGKEDSIIYDGPGLTGLTDNGPTWLASGLRGKLSGDGWELNARSAVEAVRMRSFITTVNVVGWSRGGVTCHMFANMMAKEVAVEPFFPYRVLANIRINIFAVDPVAGGEDCSAFRTKVSGNVDEYVGIYAADERSKGFSAVLPQLPTHTKAYLLTMPGRHATLVGNAAFNGASGLGVAGDGLSAPGRMTRHLARSYLHRWGTRVDEHDLLSNTQILALYENMIEQRTQFNAMHAESYIPKVSWLMTKNAGVQGQQRKVLVGDENYIQRKLPQATQQNLRVGPGTFVAFDQVGHLNENPLWVNRHHQAVFFETHNREYRALFTRSGHTGADIEQAYKMVASKYPHMLKRWEQALESV